MMTFDQIDKSVPVLLVEDEAFTATHLEGMLHSFGFETVFVCLTHKAAAEQVELGNFGLAIFDLNVGGMLSFGLISKVISTGVPVVTISGHINGADAVDGRVFLAKPIKETEFAQAIGAAHVLCHSQRVC